MNDVTGGPQTGFEFEYDGKTFSVGVMDILTQKRIATKLAPFVVPLARLYTTNPEAIAALATAGADRIGAVKIVLDNFSTIAKLLAEMPDEVTDQLMIACFRVIKMKRPGGVGWESIWNDTASCLQYDELNDLLFAGAAISAVVRSRLRSFFPTGLTT